MNWSRGLLRSWGFLSAAWIITFGYMNFDDWHSWHHARIQFEDAPKFDPSKPCEIASNHYPLINLRDTLCLLENN
jgi:hypothetical protein